VAAAPAAPGATPPAPDRAAAQHPAGAASSGTAAADGGAEGRGPDLAAVSPAAEAPHGTTASGAAAAPVAAPLPAPLPARLQAVLLDRGAAMLAGGDLSAARKLYARAADNGSGPAAEEVGKTYDPSFLAGRHAVGIRPDPALAATWYRRAIGLGDAGAAELLERVGADATAVNASRHEP
jgi:TPR repeat protein